MMEWKLVLEPDGRLRRDLDPDKEYQFQHKGDEPFVARLNDLHPLFNVFGLQYRDPPA